MKKSIITLFIICGILSLAGTVKAESESTFTQAELNTLVAPIALYPDPLLAQILPASTYPLEIVDAARLIKTEKDQKKIDKQDWDPSVKAVAHYPNVLKMMSDDLKWTGQLGQAVIAQQEDVMQAIQDKRQEAQKMGNLATTKEQIVTTNDTVIEIAPANPKIIYVPVYDPQIIYVYPHHHFHRPLITFGAFFPVGSWLNIGFYWPSRHIYYCDSGWWHGGGWHRYYHKYHHHYRSTRITNITNITNVTNVNNYYGKKSNDKHFKNHWQHDNKRSSPYKGRRYYTHNTNSKPSHKSNKSDNKTHTTRHSLSNNKTHDSSQKQTHDQSTKPSRKKQQDHSSKDTRSAQNDNRKKFDDALNKTKKHDTPSKKTATNNDKRKSNDRNNSSKITKEKTYAKSNESKSRTKISSNYTTPPLASETTDRSKPGSSRNSLGSRTSSKKSSTTKQTNSKNSKSPSKKIKKEKKKGH
ncbi:MAG: DUF3300 domain-containing protein [bacterium]|nr:DUF3300 domain-containing protein [bacterium]MBU1916553.1 DUF3300 domain-containing protein [bacterium]